MGICKWLISSFCLANARESVQGSNTENGAAGNDEKREIKNEKEATEQGGEVRSG